MLLIDVDLRKPTVHHKFNLNNDLGLTTLIADEDETIRFEEVVQYNHFVIYDAPSLGSVTDPQILAAFVDGLVFVVRRGYVSKEKVHAAITSLQNLNTIILGYVLNDVPKDSTDSYYYHSETE